LISIGKEDDSILSLRREFADGKLERFVDIGKMCIDVGPYRSGIKIPLQGDLKGGFFSEDDQTGQVLFPDAGRRPSHESRNFTFSFLSGVCTILTTPDTLGDIFTKKEVDPIRTLSYSRIGQSQPNHKNEPCTETSDENSAPAVSVFKMGAIDQEPDPRDEHPEQQKNRFHEGNGHGYLLLSDP
jgi:hypothetical protein